MHYYGSSLDINMLSVALTEENVMSDKLILLFEANHEPFNR